jgi:cell division protein FtsI/penicillin-binding protein 2
MYLWMDDLVFAERKELQTREEFLNKVAPIIKLTPDELEEKIYNYNVKNNIRWIPIAKSLTNDQWKALYNLKTDKNPDGFLAGYTFIHTSERRYPEGRLASHLVGLTNKYGTDLLGVGGLEGYWNGILSPIKGFVIKENDAFGQAIATALLPTIEPKNGSSIYTSIDKKLQQIVEQKIKQGVENYQAKRGSIIVIDPKTGQILASANFPDYDPNVREEKDSSVYGNFSVSSPYEVGSVGKTFTLAAAMDLGLIEPDTIVMENGHQGCETIHTDLLPVCTWDKKPQPAMPARECYRQSDNLCFYHIAEKMQRSDFYEYLDNFGVGRPSGIDITGESYGYLKPFDEWTIGDVSAFSYGHGYQVNDVQVLSGVATISNGGVRMKPYLVTKVVDSDGEEKIYEPIVMGRVISEETNVKMIQMMHDNYETSIGQYEYYYDDLRNYPIGMKSGTALLVENGEYVNEINATYVGFDYSEQRTFAMLVRLERPQIPAIEKLSYYNARLVWLDTFAAIKDYLNVPRI